MSNNAFIDKILVIELRDYFTQHPDQYDELSAIINNSGGKTTKMKGRHLEQ